MRAIAQRNRGIGLITQEAQDTLETFNLLNLGANIDLENMDAMLSYRLQYLKIESDKHESKKTK